MWKRLIRFLKPYTKFVILIPIFIVLEVWAYVQLPALLSRIIDQGIIPLDMSVIGTLGGQMIVFAIMEGIFSLAGLYLAARVTIGSTGDLRAATFKKIQEFTFADLDHFKVGSLITRLTNDVTQIQNMLMMLLRMALRAPVMLVASLVMLLTINAKLSLILSVGIVILVVVISLVMKKALPLFLKSQRKLDDLNSFTEESLGAIKTIKAFCREKFIQSNFGKVNKSLTDILIRVAVMMTVIFPVMSLVLNLTVVAVIWFGSGSIQAGQMEVGSLVAFINYTSQILFSLVMISFIFAMFLRAQTSVKRINDVLKRRPSIVNPKKPLASLVKVGKVEFRDVDFSFFDDGDIEDNDDDKMVLEDISFTIAPGQKLGIIGGTGSGKTILISLIMRLYDVSKGEILIDNINVKDYDLEGLRRGIGVVLQDPTLFSGTIKENLSWGKHDATEREMRNFLQMAHALEFVERNPEKLDYELARRATNLSGGQKQRLSIARALIKEARILILDDATSAVDVQTEKLIQTEIKEGEKDITMIVVGQRISSIMDSDLILVLNKGKICGQGTHEQLLRTNKTYREIYDSQMGEGKAA